MKRFIIFFSLVVIGMSAYAQEAQNYYVYIKKLNLRESPDKHSGKVAELRQYDNLVVIEEEGDWAKVRIKGEVGYVWKDYIKKGTAHVSYYEVRTGAVCKDGTRSSATGRGACSHHGGVSYWITQKKQSVDIRE